MVLEVALELAGRHVERYSGCGVEIVARALISHPWTAIAGTPEGQVGFYIVISSNPDRSATGFPLITLRPGFATRFSGPRDRISAPLFLSGIEIKSGHETADSEFSARRAHHDLAARDERSERDVVAGLVVGNCCCPDFTAGLRIEGNKHGLSSSVINFVGIQRHTAVRVMRNAGPLRPRPSVTPENVARLRVDSDHLIVGRRNEHHTVVDDRRGFVDSAFAGRERPHRAQPRNVLRRDLLQRTVALAVVGTPDHQPVARLGVLQPFRRHRLISLEDLWHRCRRRLLLRRSLHKACIPYCDERDRPSCNYGAETPYEHDVSPPALFSSGHHTFLRGASH